MTTFFLKSDIKEIAGNLDYTAHVFSGKTILITGGLGFLGSYFTALFSFLNEKVIEKPCTLILLDNMITGGNHVSVDSEGQYFKFIKYDIIEPYNTDGDTVIDFIIHAAGIASPYYYREYPLKALDVAVQGTRNVLKLARKHNSRVLYLSSSEIYGDPDPRFIPTQESYRGYVSCLGPRACYDEGKRIGETLCRIFQNRFGVEAVIVRPFNVYGPGMNENDYRVLPNFANLIKRGEPLRIYGTGEQTRTFTYITDAITGFILALTRGVPGEPYNIGSPEPEVSMLDLVGYLEKILNRKLTVNLIEYPDTYPADEPKRRCPSIRKAKLQLKYEPKVDLCEGLKRFLTWTEREYTGKRI